MNSKYFFATLLFILSFSIKLPYLFPQTTLPDEIHWLERSRTFLEKIEEKDFSHLTSHLGHPGIPAVAIMGVSEKFAQKWNSHFNFKKRVSPYYVDDLSAARLGIAFSTSLLIPLVFLFTIRYFGLAAALLSSLLLISDCQLLGLSRIAHIDSILTLLTFSTVFLFILAEEKKSIFLKLFSGIFWGLSLATKPTAVFILGFLGFYKLLNYFVLKNSEKRPKLFCWCDLWGILLGQLTLCLIFTKLWHENNNYSRVLLINPPIIERIYQYAALFQTNNLFNFSLVISLIILSYLCFCLYRKNTSNFFYNLSMLTILVFLLSLILTFFPIVAANIIRFWFRVVGFAHAKHEAYSVVFEPPDYGYAEIWYRRLPELVILGYGLAIFNLIICFSKKQSKDWREIILLIMLLIFPCIWTIPLSVSAKQSIRYLLPCFPFLYIASAFGFWSSCSRLQKKSAYALFFSLILLQALISKAWFPYQACYFNYFSGGTKAALSQGFRLTPAYVEKVLEKLHNYADHKNEKQTVEVVGDLDMINFNFKRLFPADKRFINFSHFISGISSDWVLYFTYFAKHSELDISKRYPYLRPAFAIYEEDIPIYTLYKTETPDYQKPITINPVDMNRNTGELYRYNSDGLQVVAEPESAKAGYLIKAFHLKISPGKYLVKFNVARFEGDPPGVIDPTIDQKFLNLEFSSDCQKSIGTKEVNSIAFVPIELSCEITKLDEAEIQVYWPALAAVRIGNIIIQKMEK